MKCTYTIQDGNGYIDRQELAIMLRFMGENISEQEIRDIIEEADVDKDGLIDYSEFYNMMCCTKQDQRNIWSQAHYKNHKSKKDPDTKIH